MPDVFDKQVTADRAQGYDYVGYHSYAKRRYNELVGGERWIWRWRWIVVENATFTF